MDSTLTFDLTLYRLTLQCEPLTLSLDRGGQRLLETASRAESIIGWQRYEQEVRLTFSDSTLTITLTPSAIELRWQSAQSQQLAFLNHGYWYGQGELIHQRWPLNRVMQPPAKLQTCDNGPTGLLCIQTPAWLSSNGCVVLAHSPVKFALNQAPQAASTFAWDLGAGQAPFDRRPALDPGDQGDGLLTLEGSELRVDILLAVDLPTGYQQLIQRLGHPDRLPPVGLFTQPTWTTWARYKMFIDQATVLNFAREICAHGYPHHVMEIDDIWQTHYGDLEFAPDRFPDPRGLIDQLHDLGFKVTAWVIPFINPDATAFHFGAAHGHLVQTAAGDPCRVKWWQGE